MACCLVLPKVQSSHGINLLVTWIPRVLAVEWVIDLDGWPSSMYRLLIFFLQGAIADCTLSWLVSWIKSILVTQPPWVLIWQSRMILPSPSGDCPMQSCSFPWKNLHSLHSSQDQRPLFQKRNWYWLKELKCHKKVYLTHLILWFFIEVHISFHHILVLILSRNLIHAWHGPTTY